MTRSSSATSRSKWGVWTYDFGRPGLTPVAQGLGSSQWPVWTPDSAYIIYRGTRNGFRNPYRIAANGSAGEERLTEGENLQSPSDVSSDGRWLLYSEIDPFSRAENWALPLDAESEARAVLIDSEGQISPDGNWLAYTSNGSNVVMRTW